MNRIENTEYGTPNRGCIREGKPECPHICVIPAFTIESVEGVRGFSDCFVHVEDINTTYYIDDKHRITTTWAGDLNIDNYDYSTNPMNLREQTVYDAANNLIIHFDKKGTPQVMATVPATGYYSKAEVDALVQAEARSRQSADATLSDDIEDESAARRAADAAIQDSLDDEIAMRTAADTAIIDSIDAIDTAIDKVVVTDLAIDSNQSTSILNLTESKTNIKTSESSTSDIPLPVASAIQAGVMNSATYNTVSETNDKVNALLNATVAVAGLSEAPTQQELTAAWQAASGQGTVLNSAGIWDQDNDKQWTYYTNSDEWTVTGTSQISVNIAQATNNSLGTVMGSTADGQAYAESNGTLSVNGWDKLSSSVSGKQNTLVSGTNIKTINSNSVLGSGNLTTAQVVADGSISTAKIANNAITSAKIADGAVAAADLASNSVTTAKIADGNVSTAKLAASAVTEAKVASSAISLAKLKRTVLYNNSTGSNGTITLSSSAANFTELEIFYRSNDGYYSSVKVYAPNGKTVSLVNSHWASNGANVKGATKKISGTSISTVGSGEIHESGAYYTYNYIYITRVVGYQ